MIADSHGCSMDQKSRPAGCLLSASPSQCSLSGDNCKDKNTDGCSCKTCDNGYKANAAGGCDTVGQPAEQLQEQSASALVRGT